MAPTPTSYLYDHPDSEVVSLDALRGPARFVQEGLLGRGGMGSVYLARDRETGERVALKRLERADGDSILRLKNEFRALGDSSHPNLVKLYDLTCVEGEWLLAMEYVDGTDLLSYLRPTPLAS